MKKFDQTRRRFLFGSGIALSLPALESMIPWIGKDAYAQASNEKCFVAMYAPNGAFPANWNFNGTISELRTLYNERKIVLLNGLSTSTGKIHSACGFLTTGPIGGTEEAPVVSNPSFDQYLVSRLPGAAQKQYRVLNLGSHTGIILASFYNQLSFSSRTTAVPKQTDLLRAFTSLVDAPQVSPGSSVAEQQYKRDLAIYLNSKNKSFLDFLVADANSLAARVSGEDRARLDQYLTGLREVEQRVMEEVPEIDDTGNPPMPPACQVINNQPPETSVYALQGYQTKTRAMIDIMVSALNCGKSQIATYMLDNSSGAGYLPYSANPSASIADAVLAVELATDHHGLSHTYNGDPIKTSKFLQIQKVHANMFKHLVERLDQSGLRERCIAVFGNENSDVHVERNLQFMASGPSSLISTLGQTRNYGGNEPLGKLWAAVGTKLGVNTPGFGNGSGNLNF